MTSPELKKTSKNQKKENNSSAQLSLSQLLTRQPQFNYNEFTA